VENLLCGTHYYELTLADGPTFITNVDGGVSASPNQWATFAAPISRQSLVILTTTAAMAPNVVPVGMVRSLGPDRNTPLKPGSFNHEVDHHIGAWNAKQMGFAVAPYIPVHVNLARWPKQVPDGKLYVVIDTHAYTQAGVSDAAAECLDTEVQLTIVHGPKSADYP
jgi:hypothetical protein